jgi:hypothetical protein
LKLEQCLSLSDSLVAPTTMFASTFFVFITHTFCLNVL